MYGMIWENGIETCIISFIWNDSPVQVRCTILDAWSWCTGMTKWGGRWEEGSGWGTHVYLWWIHFDIWQNQYNIVKLKNMKKKKKEKKILHIFQYTLLPKLVKNYPLIKRKLLKKNNKCMFTFKTNLVLLSSYHPNHNTFRMYPVYIVLFFEGRG